MYGSGLITALRAYHLKCWIFKQLVNTLDNQLVLGMAFVREVRVVMLLVLCNGTKERWE
jgi:hypothetical protein